jgi:hypothetical protein
VDGWVEGFIDEGKREEIRVKHKNRDKDEWMDGWMER